MSILFSREQNIVDGLIDSLEDWFKNNPNWHSEVWGVNYDGYITHKHGLKLVYNKNDFYTLNVSNSGKGINVTLRLGMVEYRTDESKEVLVGNNISHEKAVSLAQQIFDKVNRFAVSFAAIEQEILLVTHE